MCPAPDAVSTRFGLSRIRFPGDGAGRDSDLSERGAQDRLEVDRIRISACHADPRAEVAPAAGERSGREDRGGGEELAARRPAGDQPVAAHGDSASAAEQAARGSQRDREQRKLGAVVTAVALLPGQGLADRRGRELGQSPAPGARRQQRPAQSQR